MYHLIWLSKGSNEYEWFRKLPLLPLLLFFLIPKNGGMKSSGKELRLRLARLEKAFGGAFGAVWGKTWRKPGDF